MLTHALLFKPGKYLTWYYAIIEKPRSSKGHLEKHHIVPKSLGGDNSKENIVYLTVREHFVAHWLLTRIVKTELHQYKMDRAFIGMRRGRDNLKLTPIEYEAAIRAHVRATKIMNANPELKARVSSAMCEAAKKLHADPEFAARHAKRSAATMNRLHADPVFVAWRDANLKKLNADPEFRARRSQRMKKTHADPAYAARRFRWMSLTARKRHWFGENAKHVVAVLPTDERYAELCARARRTDIPRSAAFIAIMAQLRGETHTTLMEAA
jgi:hypothetical protein